MSLTHNDPPPDPDLKTTTAGTPTPAYTPDTPLPLALISLRAILLGMAGIILSVYWNVYGEVVSQTDLTSTSLMMPPIILLMVLLCWNATGGRLWQRGRLDYGELLAIYIMMTVGVVITGMGWTQFLFTTIGAAPHYATPENRWDRFVTVTPAWLLPDNPEKHLVGFYEGMHAVPWSAWIKPLCVWGAFIMTLLFAMMCMNVIVRRQWVEREKLSFPVTYLPTEMTAHAGTFWSNRLMWIGFMVPVVVESMNSFNFLFPSVPYVQIRANDLGPYFVEKPWNAIGYFPTTFYPLAIGLGFLLATDVSFSCWFFYLGTKFQNILASALGFKDAGVSGSISNIPYFGHQGAGAWVALAAMTFWMGRRHFSDVFRKAFKGDPEVDDSREFMSYRTAVFGFIFSVAAILGFWVYLGMNLIPALAYFGAYLLFALTISRMRAEAGPAWIMGPGYDARGIAMTAGGESAWGLQNQTMLGMFRWFSVELRCTPSPTQIEGFRLAEGGRLRPRHTSWVMMLAMFVGMLAGFYFCLTVWYQFGAGSAKVEGWRTYMGTVGFREAESVLNNPPVFNPMALAWAGIGAGFTMLLSFMRVHFIWFPFHPVGYALANTGTLDWLWMPFLIAWLCKVLIIRYGGIKMYRQALPFFLGLVLGDYVISGVWSLAGSMLGIRMYRMFPV